MTDKELFDSRIAPVMDAVREEFAANRQKELDEYVHSKEYRRSLFAATTPGAIMGSMDTLQKNGEWSSKTIDDYVAAVAGRLKHEGVVLSEAHFGMMLDKMAKDRMPRSTAEYILEKAVSNSMFSLPEQLSKTPLQQAVDARSEALYAPSRGERITAGAAASVFDSTALGVHGVGAVAGWTAVDLAVNRVADRKQQREAEQAGGRLVAEAAGRGEEYRPSPLMPEGMRKDTATDVTLRSFPPAERYSDLIYSDMAFSNEKWLECLSSHGIIIDTDKATLTVESSVTGQDMTYRLTADELGVLAQSELDDSPVARRLDMINAITSPDFRQQVTMEALDSDRHIDFRQAGLYVGEWDTYKPAVRRILDEKAKDPAAVGTYYEARPGTGGQTPYVRSRQANGDDGNVGVTEEQASGQSFEKREATNYSEDAYAGWRPMMQTPPERSLKMILLDTLNGISSSPATMMAMLPDMLIGMGNTSFSERNNAVPLACLFAGLFTSKQNPLLRNLLMVMGGSGLLMNAGETLRVDEARQRAVAGPMYKCYADEALDTHISDLEVRGRQMVCYYDGTLYRFNMTEEMRGAMDAGALPVNTLANRVFAAMAQSRQIAESNYAEASQSLDAKNDMSRGIR